MLQISKENIKITTYILLAFLFSIGIRMIWVYQFSGLEGYYWNNQIMINTNDGYYYAEGARDAINGFHQPNDISPINHPTSLLTALFTKILPFSFESIILFIPTFLGSLLVIPIVLIGKSLKNIELGFIAALLASIAWSYYNRTMTGYYDTDMLNIVFPTFILWALIRAIQTKGFVYLVSLAIFGVLYVWWYPQGYSLELAFFGLLLFYTLVAREEEPKISFVKNLYEKMQKIGKSSNIFKKYFAIAMLFIFKRRPSKDAYLYMLLSIMLFSILQLDMYTKVAIMVLLLVVFKYAKNIKIIYAILFIGFLLFFATGGFSPIWTNIKGYVLRGAVDSSSDNLNLHFFSVLQTVREAGQIPFETFANRISGHVVTFFVSIVGFIWLSFRHPIVLLSLPMLGLGFLAYSSGLRFTVYAVPILALGVGYLIVKLGDFIENKIARYAFMAFLTFAILYPNIVHVQNYRVPTVFNNEEVKIIDYLKKYGGREDYVISWWDYGYPLRYYGDVKTLIDGSKHHGDDNFAPSFILTQPQQVAAKMARLEVEYTEMGFQDKNNTETNMAKMMKDFGFNDSNDFLLSLNDIKLPQKTRDIFIYLPFRMMGIYPTVAKFSHIDLMTGKMKKEPFLYRATSVQDDGKIMQLGNGISLDKSTSLITIGNNKVPLKSFYVAEYDKSGKIKVSTQHIRPNGYLNLVFAKAYNAVYLMDTKTINSTYVQLFLFENYDKNLYEVVMLSPYAKLYKLKN